jgi:hypothetical protein
MAIMVNYRDGYYEINPNAEDEDWLEVIDNAVGYEKIGDLTGWGEYTESYKVDFGDWQQYYFR